jgi:hypothetical protein
MSARRKESNNGYENGKHDSDTVLNHVYLNKTLDIRVAQLAQEKRKTKGEVIIELIREGVQEKCK